MVNKNSLGVGEYTIKPFNPVTRIDYFVAYANKYLQEKMLGVISQLRQLGFSADFSYKKSLSKQMKEADRRNAQKCIIIREDETVIRDMDTGEQEELDLASFIQ
jgi:histidyl-tRNA synthetase